MTTGSGVRGKCSVCGRFIRLKKDGTVEIHKPPSALAANGPKSGVKTCLGANKKPKG